MRCQRFAGEDGSTPPPPQAAYDVRNKTWRTVAAYHCLPPWAVGTRASFRSSAIFRNESPRAR
jgi:hypothetical protein